MASAPRFVEALSKLSPLDATAWAAWREESRLAYQAYQAPRTDVSDFDLSKIVAHLNEHLPDDAIIANGAGNYTIWLHRHFRHRTPGTQIAPRFGAMG